MAHLHAIAAAIRMYRDDWGAYPPVIPRDPAASDYASRDDAGGIVSLYITEDVDDPIALVCPEDDAARAAKTIYTSYNVWLNPRPRGGRVEQLYNWYGYGPDGRALETMEQAEATYAPGGIPLRDEDGNPLWEPDPGPGLGTWTDAFCGLANPNAPDGTVVTHCPHHRGLYGPSDYRDVVARLGGHVEFERVSDFDWVRQAK